MYRYTKILLCYALATLFLVGVIFVGAKYKDEYVPVFCFTSNDTIIQITAYKESDSMYYLFLPSHISLSDTQISIPKRHTVFIDKTEMLNDMTCATFDLNVKYSLKVDGKDSSICFLQSQNTPSLFIDTATGTMERIHQDKEYRETAKMVLISNDGKTKHSDEKCAITGRGNSTWGYDKKPYVLTLSQEADLLDMGAASKWVLLANALDYSGIRNKLVLDMAKNIGFGWTPECKYVDVYLNGTYNGLYLLSEKIEIGPERLDLNLDNGDFLCSIDSEARWSIMNAPFYTDSGRAVEICAPEKPSNEVELKIHDAVNELETTLFSSEKLKNHSTFDLDSWVFRYLIDEIFCNLDSDITSSYFYSKNGVIFAGPIWDYDMSLGAAYPIKNPEAFYANLSIKHSGINSAYYSSLYKNLSFRERLKEIYKTHFLPWLNEMNDHLIDDLSESIEKSLYMNNIRWKSLYEYAYSLGVVMSPSEENSPKNYLLRRTAFLNRAFLDDEEFVSIQFNPTSWKDYQVFSMKKGDYFDIVPSIENGEWVIQNSKEPFDLSKPIETDLIIEAKSTQNNEQQKVDSAFALSKLELIVILSVIFISTLFLVFLIIEIYKFRRKGSTNER